MEKKTELEYFLNMVDKATCVVTGDLLSEEMPINTYVLEDKKEDEKALVEKPKAGVKTIRSFNSQFADCHSCPNCVGRERIYSGLGSPVPLAAFIGDGPMASDRAKGMIFSGPEGDALFKWIASIKLTRDEFYITNLVKCLNIKRVSSFPCVQEMKEEMSILRPKVILLLGQFAAQSLFNEKKSIEEYRKQGVIYFENIPLLVTYHPRDTLKNPALKKAVWQDLQFFSQIIGIEGRR